MSSARTVQDTPAAGQTSATFDVLVRGDREGEPDEHFLVKLSEPAFAFIGDGSAVGVIVDDEPRITLEYVAPLTEGNTGSTPVSFKVRLTSAAEKLAAKKDASA